MDDLTNTTNDIVAAAVYIKVPNSNVTSAFSGPAVVGESMFGSVFTTYQPLSKFLASSATVFSHLIRYPGGALAEDSVAKYSLRFDDVYAEPKPGDPGYDATAQKGLTDVLAAAVATHSDFSMVIPTRRYMSDVATGVEDLTFFLRRLLHGDFGPLPDHVILELGNETSWLGWVNGVFTPGEGSYGYLANAFLEAIRTVLEDPVDNPNGIEIDVALQIGTTAARGQAAIFDQIAPENLRTVDAFIRHSALLDNISDSVDIVLHGYDFQYEQQKLADAMAYWDRAWNGNPPELVLFDSAWSVGGGESVDEAGGVTFDHLGVGQGPAVVLLVSALIAGGGDIAAVWGATAAASSMFGIKGTQLSYGGEAFRLMSESLVGTSLVSGNLVNGQWVNTNSYMDVVTYQDDSKVVTFVCGSDFPPGGVEVTIDLSAFGYFSYAWAEVIRSPDSELDSHAVGDMFDAEVERYLVPILHGPEGDSIHITMTHDHELVRIILAKEVPGNGSLYLYGSEASDSLYGALGGDSLYGNGGNDLIDARSGNDSISAGLGDDLVYGGSGLDRVYGGDGADLIYAGEDDDVVYGGTTAADVRDTIYGGTGRDMIYGGSGSDSLLGDDGSDTLDGGWGADNLIGGTGNDWLFGGTGNDSLFGWGGDDRLIGGAGVDYLYGGAGRDRFDFVVAAVASEYDRIRDFNVADDTIRLSAAVFHGMKLGTLPYDQFVVGKAALDANDRIIYDPARGMISYDDDGNGPHAAIALASVTVGLPLTALDFVVF